MWAESVISDSDISFSIRRVTGLPEPQKEHAVIMARFAFDCQTRMSQILPDLVASLGPETAQLSMRFGLHSGPVTAGVLRGDKGRFQLFGDTVNTAARMESNGQAGRIQVSEATAKLLINAGLERWTQSRKDLVAAKGKGMMQTYWISKRSASDERSAETGSTSQEESQNSDRMFV